MVLFLIYVEPLLVRLQELCPVLILKGRELETLKAPLVDGIQENQESFVDDVELLCTSNQDFIVIDECVARFEKLSGALLNRSSKSKVLGLGAWRERDSWPLTWLKSVNDLKVFGIILTNNYDQIIDKN